LCRIQWIWCLLKNFPYSTPPQDYIGLRTYPIFHQSVLKSWSICSYLHGPLHYLKLESYINFIINILYLHFYTWLSSDSREVRAKRAFASAGPDAPTWSALSCTWQKFARTVQHAAEHIAFLTMKLYVKNIESQPLKKWRFLRGPRRAK